MITLPAPPRPTWGQLVTYAVIGDRPARCVSAEHQGYRCARLPDHGGQCVAITDMGALRRFPYREPHPDQVVAARAVEAVLRRGVDDPYALEAAMATAAKLGGAP